MLNIEINNDAVLIPLVPREKELSIDVGDNPEFVRIDPKTGELLTTETAAVDASTIESMTDELDVDSLPDDRADYKDVRAILAERAWTSRPIRTTASKMTHGGRLDWCDVDQIVNNLMDRGAWRVVRGVPWLWNPKTGVWHAAPSVQAFQTLLADCGIRKCHGESTKAAYSGLIAERSLRERGLPRGKRRGMVAFADAVLDVATGEAIDHDIALGLTYKLDMALADYAEHPRLTEFAECMQSIAGSEEAAARLQEMLGVALSAVPAGNLLFLESKDLRTVSMILSLLESVLDEEYIAFLSARDMDKNFRVAHVIGKKLLISAKEGEALVKDLEMVLRLIAGDGINADRKYADAVDFVPEVTMICGGRRLPRVQIGSIFDAHDHIVRVKLEGSFPDGLMTRSEFLECRAELVAWALDGLRRYLDSRCVYTEATGCAVVDQFQSAHEFAVKRIRPKAGASIATSRLLEAYREQCGEDGVSDSDFKKIIRETYGIKAGSVRARDADGQSRVFSGYRGIELWNVDATDDDEDDFEPDFIESTLLGGDDLED